MADCYAFADEAGNFDFSHNTGASRNFILCTVTMKDPAAVAGAMMKLRMDLAWQGLHLDQVFHATTDPQAVRDDVFAAVETFDLRIDATILDKTKAQRHLQSESALYKMAWYLHFKHVAPRIAKRDDRLFVGAASLGTKKKRKAFHDAVNDVVWQVSPCASHRVAFWPFESHACLQVADYCTWAIQRKWERSDTRSFDLISDKVKTDWAAWRHGPIAYY
jgi:hypothetical protein